MFYLSPAEISLLHIQEATQTKKRKRKWDDYPMMNPQMRNIMAAITPARIP